VRIFDRGDFYTAHGDNASFIARTVMCLVTFRKSPTDEVMQIYKTTSVLRQLGKHDSTGLPSVTMSTTVFRNFLREALFRLGKRIEVWENTGRMNWKVTKQASPGNLQDIEEELGGQFDAAPIILAVKVSAKASEARNVGVCFADASVRELGVSEFLDSDLYSNFESLLIQLGVKECLIQVDKSEKDVEMTKLKAIIENCGIAISERPGSEFGAKDIDQDLARLLKDEKAAGTLPQTDLKLAMGSAAALIKYLGALHDPSNFGQYQLYQHDLSQFMKLRCIGTKSPESHAWTSRRCKDNVSLWLAEPLQNPSWKSVASTMA
jgi:DNA mismatch repair protein MSH2